MATMEMQFLGDRVQILAPFTAFEKCLHDSMHEMMKSLKINWPEHITNSMILPECLLKTVYASTFPLCMYVRQDSMFFPSAKETAAKMIYGLNPFMPLEVRDWLEIACECSRQTPDMYSYINRPKPARGPLLWCNQDKYTQDDCSHQDIHGPVGTVDYFYDKPTMTAVMTPEFADYVTSGCGDYTSDGKSQELKAVIEYVRRFRYSASGYALLAITYFCIARCERSRIADDEISVLFKCISSPDQLCEFIAPIPREVVHNIYTMTHELISNETYGTNLMYDRATRNVDQDIIKKYTDMIPKYLERTRDIDHSYAGELNVARIFDQVYRKALHYHALQVKMIFPRLAYDAAVHIASFSAPRYPHLDKLMDMSRQPGCMEKETQEHYEKISKEAAKRINSYLCMLFQKM